MAHPHVLIALPAHSVTPKPECKSAYMHAPIDARALSSLCMQMVKLLLTHKRRNLRRLTMTSGHGLSHGAAVIARFPPAWQRSKLERLDRVRFGRVVTVAQFLSSLHGTPIKRLRTNGPIFMRPLQKDSIIRLWTTAIKRAFSRRRFFEHIKRGTLSL